MADRNTTIALQLDEIGLQGLANHMVPNQDFHGGVEVSLKEAQGTKICNMDGARLFLQKDLKAGLPAREGITMVEGHFLDEGMEFSNARAVHTGLVVTIGRTE